MPYREFLAQKSQYLRRFRWERRAVRLGRTTGRYQTLLRLALIGLLWRRNLCFDVLGRDLLVSSVTRTCGCPQ
jgi:hypothetical protein